MTRHPVRKVFRDLLSLQGYPLPFESIERLVEADGAAAAVCGTLALSPFR